MLRWILCVVLLMALSGASLTWAQRPDPIREPYRLDPKIQTRSISFENPQGEPGGGGKAASNLGVGRKGAPAREIKPGETVTLCDISGRGTVRHIWLTTEQQPAIQRSALIRAWWDGQDHPSIDCPIGDFFGFAHGKITAYASAVHSVGPTGGRNIWLPMPFIRRAKITFSNEGNRPIPLFYQIGYTLGDDHAADVGRLHVVFRRENPTTEKQDFVILPKRNNPGRYLGAVIGIRNLHADQWWGEGEIKVYMDGDSTFPTIVGTGSEDYVGLAWGLQHATFPYNGASLVGKEFNSMYRWHLPDPIAWHREARITIQQIAYKHSLAETHDDWSTATFWYEPTPSAPLPTLPDVKARTADLPEK
jgi:hypothetical protein